jgi:SulP family sulfate permease
MGIESGILAGVVTTFVVMMWKMSRPHVAEVGRVGATEHFRNVKRFDVLTSPGVFAFRIDESLSFANAGFLLAYIMEQLADRPTIRHVLLISSGINDVDATGLDTLETIRSELDQIGVGFHMSDVKGPVTDRLRLAGFDEQFLKEHIYLSADEAMRNLSSPKGMPPGMQ